MSHLKKNWKTFRKYHFGGSTSSSEAEEELRRMQARGFYGGLPSGGAPSRARSRGHSSRGHSSRGHSSSRRRRSSKGGRSSRGHSSRSAARPAPQTFRMTSPVRRGPTEEELRRLAAETEEEKSARMQRETEAMVAYEDEVAQVIRDEQLYHALRRSQREDPSKVEKWVDESLDSRDDWDPVTVYYGEPPDPFQGNLEEYQIPRHRRGRRFVGRSSEALKDVGHKIAPHRFPNRKQRTKKALKRVSDMLDANPVTQEEIDEYKQLANVGSKKLQFAAKPEVKYFEKGPRAKYDDDSDDSDFYYYDDDEEDDEEDDGYNAPSGSGYIANYGPPADDEDEEDDHEVASFSATGSGRGTHRRNLEPFIPDPDEQF